MRTKQALTERFLLSVHEILRRSNGKGSYSDLAHGIGVSNQSLNRVIQKQQLASISQVEGICKRYRVNPTYLILGEGEMFLAEDLGSKVLALEKRVKALERR